MAYNPPRTGHVVIVLDNGTTAMTGQQEHPGTGRRLDHGPTNQLSIEGLATAIGIPSVTVIDAYAEPEEFERLLLERLAAPELSVIVARRPCILAAADIRKWEGQAAEFRARAAEQSAVCEPAEENR
jgi:indolepyruvate ferredoxin oxidoreductase alpha subunit